MLVFASQTTHAGQELRFMDSAHVYRFLDVFTRGKFSSGGHGRTHYI